MSHSAGSVGPQDRVPPQETTPSFPTPTGWGSPDEVVDGAPSGGWGTPGEHLTGPIPRLRSTTPPPEEDPSPTWAPSVSGAQPPPSGAGSDPAETAPEPAGPPPAAPPIEHDTRSRGLSSLLDFGFTTRGTRALVPVVYGLVVAYAVLVFLLDLLAALGGVGITVVLLDVVRALVLGSVRLVLLLGAARILLETALHVLQLVENRPGSQ